MLKNEPFLLNNRADHACLLLHGLGGGVYEMYLLALSLHQAGYTVQAFNYPGHEDGIGKMPPSTWQQWYESVKANYQQLYQNYGSVSIIGFSTGCPLALYLATDYPVKNLVLLSPFLAIKKPWFSPFKLERYVSLLGGIIKEVPRLNPISKAFKAKDNSKKSLGLESFNLDCVKSALELINLVKVKLSNIKVPTLIIQSPLDSVVEPSGASFIYDHLASEDKQLIWLEKSDHIITLDVERERVFQEVKQFLAQYSS